uniref:uncharacterized protein LOC751650 isoform 2 n=1 Tax=Danio rerio TaxID=7955 RepID=UPI003D7FBE0C
MAFPVDILTNVDHESLEQAAEEYMSQLPYRKPEYLILPNSKQIEIGLCNVSFVPLYGADTKKKILALFSPDDSITVVGLYLLGKWWGVEEVLKTAEPSRTGLIKVSTLGERIVLYVLNRIVLRNEKSGEEVFFLCHGEHESAKILWKDGVAIGFYSFKPKGSLCKNFVTQCYQLPVMDTVFVRKCHRGKDHGVKILEDFFCSFRNEDTGLKFPLSEAMYKVCEKYLRIYPADKEFLWEVENTGGFFQRTLIAKRLQGLKQKEKDHVVSKLIFEEEDATAPMEIEITKIQETTESTMEIESTTDTVTATVTRISEFRSSQKEMGKYIITATSDGTPVTQLTTSEEIKSKKGSKEEFGMVKEHTVEIQGTIIGSNDESQLQSVVNVEIVKMSTGTEEEQHENLENKDLEEDKSVSETGKGEIRQMLDELEGGNAQSETDETFSRTEVLEEITEQPEIHAKLSEKEQVSWDVEITEKKEREGSEVIEVHGKDLIEENRNDNLSPEKCETIHKNIVLQQSVKIKDQTEMEVLCTEEVLCEQQKLCEAEKEVSEPHQRKTYKGTAFEKAKKNKVGPDDTKQVFSQSKLTQKRTSPETPSRRSKRLRHEPAEMIKMTKSVKTSQQRTKHHSKAVIQEEHTEQPVDKYEHDSSKVIEESSAEHQSGAENEVKECIENELTVETVSTVDNEIRQIEKTLYVVPAVSELVKGAEKSHEEVLQQSSAGPIEVQESKTTFEEHEERVEHSKTKVVIIEFDEVSSKKAGDDHGEMDIVEQGELKDLVSTKHQIAEDTLVEEQDGTLNMDTKPMEELACTTGGYIVATDVSVTQEQENKSEVKTTDLIVQGKDEKTTTEHSKKDQQDSYEEDKQYPKQGEQAKKKKLTDVSSRSTRLRDQPIDPGVTPVRRSTRSKEVIQHKLSQPQTRAKILTEKRIDMDENVTPEESEMTNTNIDKATATSSGSSELLKATETDDKVEVPQITEATEEKIPAVEVENDDATEKATKEIKKMTNEEINLAGETDIEMCSLVHEQDIHAPVSTEISLRHRTIKVTSTPIKKSGRVQKREDEVVVEHQARHTLMSKKKNRNNLSYRRET